MKGGTRMRGTMLWFNETKDRGAIAAEDGEQVSVVRTAFVGAAPEGRCGGTPVEFTLVENGDGRTAHDVAIVEELAPRRARRRR